ARLPAHRCMAAGESTASDCRTMSCARFITKTRCAICPRYANRWRGSLPRCVSLAFLAAAIGSAQEAANGLPVTYEMLLKAASPPANWLMYGGDYRSHHYSSLNQINTENIQRLRAKWIYQMHRSKVEATPIVLDGIMYLTRPPSDVIALDA